MEQKDCRLAAIMYTDIVGFSRMMERDKAGALALLSFHNKLITDIAQKHNSTFIKTIKDAFLVDFHSTISAVKCAMEIQDALYTYNSEHKEQPLLLRIGIHLGDIYFYENDMLGDGINIAARLQGIARPGGICISQDVYNQVLNKLDFKAENLGIVSLKNISKEIHVYEIVSSNIQFDPNKDKMRAGYISTNGYFASPVQAQTLQDTTVTPDTIAPTQSRLAALKETIKQKSLSLPRRLTIEEALKRYGDGSVEVQAIIAELAQEGILLRSFTANETPQTDSSAAVSNFDDVAAYIGKTVEEVVRTIETKVSEWQKTRSDRGSSGRRSSERRIHDTYGTFVQGEPTEIPEVPLDQLSKKEIKQRVKKLIKQDSEELPTGKWDKEISDSEYFAPGKEELANDFDTYKEQCEDQSTKAIGGFVGNLLSFAAINGAFWAYIYPQFTQGVMLWPAIVSAAWGTSIISNLISIIRKRKKVKEMRKMPYLEGETLQQYKMLNRTRDSMASHTAKVLTVPALLGVINWVVTPGFWWAIIPSIFIALSFLGHLGAYPATLANLKRKICERMGVRSWKNLFSLHKIKPRKKTTADTDYLASAEALREDIVQLIETNPTLFNDEELKPAVDSYINQIKLLTASINEIDAIVNSIPHEALKNDKAALVHKLEAAQNPMLKEEIQKSISEIEKQEHAIKELVDQNEVLKLRIKSSINTLNQLKLDMTRLKAMPKGETHNALETLRTRTHELSNYISDLRTGYLESTKDPFAELEKLARDEELKNKESTKEN